MQSCQLEAISHIARQSATDRLQRSSAAATRPAKQGRQPSTGNGVGSGSEYRSASHGAQSVIEDRSRLGNEVSNISKPGAAYGKVLGPSGMTSPYSTCNYKKSPVGSSDVASLQVVICN